MTWAAPGEGRDRGVAFVKGSCFDVLMPESDARSSRDLQPPEGVQPRVCDIRVRFSDIDGMGHMNNANYLTFTEEARSIWAHEDLAVSDPDGFSFILAHARVDFLAAANLGDVVRVEMWTSRIGGKSWDFSYRLVDSLTGRVFATAMTTQVAYDYAREATVAIPDDLRRAIERYAESKA